MLLLKTQFTMSGIISIFQKIDISSLVSYRHKYLPTHPFGVHATLTLPKKCPYLEFFWSTFSHIRIKYGDLQSNSPYSVRMWENKDTFYVVQAWEESICDWPLAHHFQTWIFSTAMWLSYWIMKSLMRAKVYHLHRMKQCRFGSIGT